MVARDLRREIPILLLMAILIGLGWVMVFSTAAVQGLEAGTGNVFYHLKRQVLATGLGAIGLVLASRLPLADLDRIAPRVLGVAGALMLVVFVPGIGKSVAHATRWINLGVISFQPVEVFKLAVVLWYARLLAAERPGAAWSAESWTRILGLAALSVGMPILQRDFGSAFLMMALGGVLIWLAGARTRSLAAFAGLGATAAVALVAIAPYRLHRIRLYLSSFGSLDGGGYQTKQSLIALGAGGPLGVGLGESSQKLLYLPSAHADFIFAIIGEELGFIGAFITLALYVLLLREGLAIARASDRRNTRLLSTGLALLLFLQAVWHIAVSLVLVPTKGLALPFVSYGGSSLMASMTAVGVLLRCAAEAPRSASEPSSAEAATRMCESMVNGGGRMRHDDNAYDRLTPDSWRRSR